MREFRSRAARSSTRQEAIQRYCCAQLERRGIAGAAIEVRLPGAYRAKNWDVGLVVEGEPRLGISCKSIISNHGGTVPNRVDDMLGEAANLHRLYPSAVLGYLFMMSRIDESAATVARTARGGGMTPERLAQLQASGDTWFARLVESVSKAASRSDPQDFPEKFEVVSCSQVDFTTDPYLVVVDESGLSPEMFFDRLVEIYRERFPA